MIDWIDTFSLFIHFQVTIRSLQHRIPRVGSQTTTITPKEWTGTVQLPELVLLVLQVWPLVRKCIGTHSDCQLLDQMQWQLINAGLGRAGKVKKGQWRYPCCNNNTTVQEWLNPNKHESKVRQSCKYSFHSYSKSFNRNMTYKAMWEICYRMGGGTGVGTVKYLSLPSSLALHYPGTSVIVCNYISLLMRSMNRYIKGYLELKCWYNISRKYLYNCIVTEPSGISGSTATEAQQVLQPRLNVFHIGFPQPEVVEL